jgi:hypothetical protein
MSKKTSIDNTNDLLSKLIEKLEETHILQREVLIAVRSITEAKDPQVDTTAVVTPQYQTDTAPALAFKVGDLVQVTNRIRQPFGSLKRATGNPSGVVVRITKRRIHVKLNDTGLIVQRDPSNVKHQRSPSAVGATA